MSSRSGKGSIHSGHSSRLASSSLVGQGMSHKNPLLCCGPCTHGHKPLVLSAHSHLLQHSPQKLMISLNGAWLPRPESNGAKKLPPDVHVLVKRFSPVAKAFNGHDFCREVLATHGSGRSTKTTIPRRILPPSSREMC